MGISAHVTGKVHGEPVKRISKSGNEFISVRLSVPVDGGKAMFCSLTAFGELMNKCRELKVGMPVSAIGGLSVQTYQAKDGSTRVSLSMIADDVVCGHRKGKGG